MTLTIAAATATPTPARACGGFFCDTTQPVNQAAERIIFSRGDDGQVTAVIQILYAGPAERFAWMLPVHGSPRIAVSSNLAFTRLQQATNPTFQLTTSVEGTCRTEQVNTSEGSGDAWMAQDSLGTPAPDPDTVQVVDRGSVGPYDYVVISVAADASLPAAAAVEWLRDNGFEIDDFGAERIGPYLESGMNLLSFRLTKGNVAGAIRPVILNFGAGVASIPIRPTAVAAVDDMGVMVWVAGPHRAYPINYASLELNTALIDWISPNSNYNAVVTEAANQAGGQGFVTEMAGSGRGLMRAILSPEEDAAVASILNNPARIGTPSGLAGLINTFRSFDGLADALAPHLVIPANRRIEDLLNCWSCVPLATDADGMIRDFDVTGFLAAFDAEVIAPMRATQALFDRPVVTRLYTTMSAEEMTVDPSFGFNPDLPKEVAWMHTASQVIECSGV